MISILFIADASLFDLDDIQSVHVLNLKRLVQLKEKLGREKDRAVLPVLRRTLEESSSD